jgi:hypothetical protein
VPKPLSSAALVVYAFAIALGLGVTATLSAVEGDPPFGALSVGPWVGWPQAGSRTADPYARAIAARRAELPLAVGEGLALRATQDSAGQALDSRCAYRIGAVTPQARLWTLTVYDGAGRLRTSDLERSGYTSGEILREPDGRFWLSVGPSAQPGNWLKTPATERFSLILRLYDTPVAATSSALNAEALPKIERLDCEA